MKNILCLALAIFTLVSCGENTEEKVINKEVNEISVHQVEGTFDTEIKRPTFTAVASSYTTNRVPDSELIGITNVTITEKLNCNAENERVCEELNKYFDSSEFIFISSEEHASIVEGRKNVLKIKGTLKYGEKQINATFFFTAHEFDFKGNIIIKTPTEFTSTRESTLSISVKGKFSK